MNRLSISRNVIQGLILGLACVMGTAGTAEARNLIVNGSFESPSLFGSNTVYPAGYPFLTGWTIGGEGIDHDATFQAADGVQTISLRWHDPSNVSQAVPTSASQWYRLGFAATRERPEGSAAAESSTRGVEVWWNSSLVATVILPPDLTQTDANMHWQYYSFNVLGTGGFDTLRFQDIDSGVSGYGAELDDVSCIAVPTPGAAALAIMGAVMGVRRRR